MSALPAAFVVRQQTLIERMAIFGVPLKSLSQDELLAVAAYSIEGHRAAVAVMERLASMNLRSAQPSQSAV